MMRSLQALWRMQFDLGVQEVLVHASNLFVRQLLLLFIGQLVKERAHALYVMLYDTGLS